MTGENKTMEVIPVPGDGDCFYHAFIKGLGLEVSPKHLRTFVADKIMSSTDLYKDILDDWKSQNLLRGEETLSAEQIAHRIRYNKEWATTTVIHILADAFNCRVIVYKSINGRYLPQVFPYIWTFDPKVRKFNKTISIYNHGGHFDLLTEVKDDGDDGSSFMLPPLPNVLTQRGGGKDTKESRNSSSQTVIEEPIQSDYGQLITPFFLGLTVIATLLYFV